MALDASPEPYNPRLLYNIAFSLKMNGSQWSARYHLSEMLKQDSVSFLAHRALHMYATGDNDAKKVELHERWLNEIAPWYLKEN
jgi:hypothetical protein